VRLLLDTHILLWWLADDRRLPPAARDVIASGDVPVFVSAATAWEISIKRALGRLEAPEDLLGALHESDLDALPISVAHALAAGALPPHHGDPFDRMLIAQAQSDGLVIVTADPAFAAYDVDVLPLS
jgi:PIN domain nuclease of toxin-antitoxin system